MPKSSTKAEIVAYRWQRHHTRLQVGERLCTQSKRRDPVRVFFGQGDTDGACGLHTFLMVLVVFDLAKRMALENMSRRKYGLPSEVWAVFAHTYFCGVNAPELMGLVSSLKLPLNLSLRQDKDGGLDKWTVDSLMRGELVAVTFVSVKNGRTNHWALCVGCEGFVLGLESQTDTILLLDPSGAEPVFKVSNALLRVPKASFGSHIRRSPEPFGESKGTASIHWLYESPDWASESVRLTAAVRFRLIPGM